MTCAMKLPMVCAASSCFCRVAWVYVRQPRVFQDLLVQCKRWAAEKTVHENHVFQLAGSVFEYQYQHPRQAVSGALVTSTSLSEVTQRCAEYLGIRIFSGVPFQEYPRIKCNIGKSGQKIYHLPVDQQYDTALVDSPGESYEKNL